MPAELPKAITDQEGQLASCQRGCLSLEDMENHRRHEGPHSAFASSEAWFYLVPKTDQLQGQGHHLSRRPSAFPSGTPARLPGLLSDPEICRPLQQPCFLSPPGLSPGQTRVHIRVGEWGTGTGHMNGEHVARLT